MQNLFDIEAAKKTLYCDVILPLYLPKLLTYSIPLDLLDKIQIGIRVQVSVKNKHYSAIIYDIHEKKPAFTAKPIIDILDEQPIVHLQDMNFWIWMSQYYMTTPGSVMHAALPAGLKLNSESYIFLNKDITIDYDSVDDYETLILDALSNRHYITLAEIEQILGKKTIMPHLNSLSVKRYIIIEEHLQEKFVPKVSDFVWLNDRDHEIEVILDSLERSPKQQTIILALLELRKHEELVSKKKLLERADASAAQLKALSDKGFLTIQSIRVDRIHEYSKYKFEAPQLSPAQDKCLLEIQSQFQNKNVVLLHGVTGSGKTNIYMHLAKEVLKQGKRVLYLLPEIALTYQITERMKNYFGNALAVYHSKFNNNERVEIWYHTLQNKFGIILGARSAMFLPMQDIGLIIIDEEHDPSYKQSEDPMYHARDAAIYLASRHQQCKVLLGSATPSVESLYLAQTQKYGFSSLTERYNQYTLPEIEIINIKDAAKRDMMKLEFSTQLLDTMHATLAAQEQCIFFQNRRGYAPYIQCNDCEWVPKCKNCDVSLTYHKAGHELRCHYCGFITKMKTSCDVCGNNDLRQKGFGTEKIEEDLQLLYPTLRIARMDLDTVRNKTSHQEIINDIQKQNIDVLIGTQMVSKGLDFEHVTLVGIINADQLLFYPDFRSNERAIQLLTQVAGRSGRSHRRGKVLVQTTMPTHPIIIHFVNHTLKEFYEEELLQRERFHFPPFYRVIEIKIHHKDEDQVIASTQAILLELRKLMSNVYLSSTIPIVSKIRNYYIRHILIKFNRETIPHLQVKQALQTAINTYMVASQIKQLIIRIDVDPN